MTEDEQNSISRPIPRQVCVAVAYRLVNNESTRVEYLLVTSRKHSNRWVLPKGGIEPDEVSNPGLGALREAWEEGGIKGKLIKFLYHSIDSKLHKEIKGKKCQIFIPRSEYSFWLISVNNQTEICNSWPEENERKRKWVRRQEAIELVKWRQDGAVEALMKVDEQSL